MKLVLLIDDEPEILELLEYVFNQLNYRVTSFPDVLPLETIKEISPDLIILDHNLGQKSGGDLCKELKANPETHDIPVLMLSANERIAEIAKDNCADAFLLKPFDIAALHRAVKTIITLETS